MCNTFTLMILISIFFFILSSNQLIKSYISGYRFSKNIQRFIHIFFQKANRLESKSSIFTTLLESISKLDCSNIIVVIVFYNNYYRYGIYYVHLHKAARISFHRSPLSNGNLMMRIYSDFYDIETPSAGTHFFEEETMAAC